MINSRKVCAKKALFGIPVCFGNGNPSKGFWILVALSFVPFSVGCTDSTSERPGNTGRLTLRSYAANDSSATETKPISAAESHDAMIERLHQIAENVDNENIWIGEGQVEQLRLAARNISSSSDNLMRFRTHYMLARGESVLGNEQAAIDNLMKSYELLDDIREELGPGEDVECIYRLGLAHLRVGETQNCCNQNSAQSCILPLRDKAIHTDQDGSRQAIEFFSEALANTDGRHYRARWLLNIAYMTVGEYPDQVPDEWLISPETFDSGVQFPKFDNVAIDVGLNTFNLVGSVVVEDFDNDGFLDILTSTWDPTEQIRYFRNCGNGQFDDLTVSACLTGLLGGINMVQADYDNDGDIDVLVLRGAWLFDKGRHPNSLLRNEGDGTFVDVAIQAGLADVDFPSHVAAWGDYDNDGWIDIYIGNEMPAGGTNAAAGQLFRNNGDGTFQDKTLDAGVANHRFAKGVAWGDYNHDRYPDLFISNMQGRNRLYRNDGDGTFTDVAEELGVAEPVNSFPAWFWDFDNDGRLDLFVPSYCGDKRGMDAMVADSLGEPTLMDRNHLFRGMEGGFEEVSDAMGLRQLTSPMGCNFGDLDNDGYLDFYLGTGFPEYEAIMPNLMYRNRGGNGFEDVTFSGGFGHLQKGHGVAFCDLDNDGDQDVFEQIGGNFLGDKYYDALFRNPGFDNNWIKIKLIGVDSNCAAIGARIHIVIEEEGESRSIYRHVNSGGSFGANPLMQSIGLGKAQTIQRLEIFWPTTGETQTMNGISANQFVVIEEGDENYQSIELKSFEFKTDSTIETSITIDDF